MFHELSNLEAFDSMKALSSMRILLLLSKIKPTLLAERVAALQLYLTAKNKSLNGCKLVCCVAELLEEVVPVMENPSKTLLDKLENKLVTLMLSGTRDVAHSCFSLLSTVINKITKNYNLMQGTCEQ